MRKLRDLGTMLEDARKSTGALLRRGRREIGALAEVIDERTQTMRLAARIRQLNREHNELLAQIGAKVYALHTQGKVTNQEVAADCQHIASLRADVADLRHQIDELRAGAAVRGIVVEVTDETPLTAEEAPVAEAEALEAAPPMPEASQPTDPAL